MGTEQGLKPRKKPRQQRAQATYDAILEATAQLLVAEGYDKASTNKIAKRAGVSVGSLYQYFPSKEAIVLTIAQEHGRQMVELLEETALEAIEAPLHEAIHTYVRANIRAHSLDPALHRVLVQQILHLGAEHLRELEMRAVSIVRLGLERRKDEILPQDLDMAAHILVKTVVLLTKSTVLDSPELLEQDAFVDEVSALVLRYLIGGRAIVEA